MTARLIVVVLVSLMAGNAAEEIVDDFSPIFADWYKGKVKEHARNNERDFEVAEGKFLIKTRLFAHPTLEFDYIVPIVNKVPAASSPDIVVFFPYPGQKVKDFWPARQLALRHGFSVLTAYFPNHGQANDGDRTKYYIYPESGSGEAWLKGISGFKLITRMPTVGKIFVAGFSAGGSAAQLFSSYAKENVESAVYAGGRTFNLEQPFVGPVLLLHSTLDRIAENAKLEELLTRRSFPPLHLSYPPEWKGRGVGQYWFHNVDESGWSVAHQWLTSIANARIRQGSVPAMKTWPEFEGRRIPDKELVDVIRGMAEEPKLSYSANGQTQMLAFCKKGSASASVFWISHRFSFAGEDFTALGNILNKDAINCVGVAYDSEISDVVARIKAVDSTRGDLVKPRILVLDQPENGAIREALAISRIDALLILDVSEKFLRGNIEDIRNSGVKTRVTIKQGGIDEDGSRFDAKIPGIEIVYPDKAKKSRAIGDLYAEWESHILSLQRR